MSKSEKEKKEIKYKFFAAFCMYILRISDIVLFMDWGSSPVFD